MTIDFAAERDIDRWMHLVEKVKKSFPGLETAQALDEHRKTVLAFMDKASAICAKEQEKVVGALLFSDERNELCFLAVDPVYRRRHIAENMVSLMLAKTDPHRDITVTTFCEGVPEGTAARAFYKKIGFIEGERTQAFGSPVQEFVLKR